MNLRHIQSAALTGLAALALVANVPSLAVAQSEPAAAEALASFPSTATANYQIRPGDVIAVSVYNEPGLSQASVRVLPGGLVQEPLAGAVKVSGLTPVQAGVAFQRALRKYLRNPAVTVTVAAVAPVDVYVFGNVKTPGKYQLQPDSHIVDALAAAGGLNPTDGDYPDAKINTGGVDQTVSLQKLLRDGDVSLNTPIRNQMTINVPSPVTYTVLVQGAVEHQGETTMHEGDKLINAIARAGPSSSSNADLNHVTVQHRDSAGHVDTQVVNMYEIYKNGNSSKDLTLAKGDIVIVPPGRQKSNASDYTNPFTTILYSLMHI